MDLLRCSTTATHFSEVAKNVKLVILPLAKSSSTVLSDYLVINHCFMFTFSLYIFRYSFDYLGWIVPLPNNLFLTNSVWRFRLVTSVEASWIYESFGAVFVFKQCQGDGEESRWNPRICSNCILSRGKRFGGIGDWNYDPVTHFFPAINWRK